MEEIMKKLRGVAIVAALALSNSALAYAPVVDKVAESGTAKGRLLSQESHKDEVVVALSAREILGAAALLGASRGSL